MTPLPPITIVSVAGQPLSVALREPFVIATGRIDVTRAVLVSATVQDASGRRATGFGEAAALPPVTVEDQPDLLAAIAQAGGAFHDGPPLGKGIWEGPGEGAWNPRRDRAYGPSPPAPSRLQTFADVTAAVERALPHSAVARAGVESAIVDAWGRLAEIPLFHAWGGPAAAPLLFTDITLPISDPAHMSRLARDHRDAGFTSFKVKVGRDWRADLASLRAVAAQVADARFRLDANAGFSARDALALLHAALADGLIIECFEQPCATDDIDGMATVTAGSPVPVVADESFRGAGDLDRLLAARAAHAVNLKLAKLGGPLNTLTLARRARAAGLQLMAGAMVETRVGLLAMAHVVVALGGVDWVDLDTAFLLAADPFVGGWTTKGPRLQLTGLAGLGVELAPAS